MHDTLGADDENHVAIGLHQLVSGIFVKQTLYFPPKSLFICLFTFKHEETHRGSAEDLGHLHDER